MALAYGAASPLVHISGALPLKADLEPFYGVDDPAFVNEMFKPITKWAARVERLADVPAIMAKAFHIARNGRPDPVDGELPRVSDYSEFVLQEVPATLSAYKSIPTVVTHPEADNERDNLIDERLGVCVAGGNLNQVAPRIRRVAVMERPLAEFA